MHKIIRLSLPTAKTRRHVLKGTYCIPTARNRQERQEQKKREEIEVERSKCMHVKVQSGVFVCVNYVFVCVCMCLCLCVFDTGRGDFLCLSGPCAVFWAGPWMEVC